MAFFTKPTDAATAAPAPLTRDRLEALMTRREWYFGIDDDGDLGGVWDENTFYFLLVGEPAGILQIRGRWSRTLPVSGLGTLTALINEWNVGRIWPKVFARPEDDGSAVVVYAEVATDLRSGANDEQLERIVDCGLATGLSFFEMLDERYPAGDGPQGAEQEAARPAAGDAR
ncbi:YbjN domain-containing protein [Isoptericola sp. NPDC056618]|uniref:YbjN domain-containing protein n=1 Tax=Isoptericola sp. NPDC056618 TaxID=3345878 RepID=UPI0036A21C91